MAVLAAVAGVVTALVLLVLFLVWPGGSDAAQHGILVGHNFAHRGLHTRDKAVPENSLAAFDAACTAGYGIELDLQLSSDGQVMVFHDDTLERVAGVAGRVDAFTCEELQAMQLCGTEQRIPLFAEVLALVDGRGPLIVELKKGPRNTELCQKAAALLDGYAGPFCIESFDPRIVRWFRKNRPGILRGQLSAPSASLRSGLAGTLVSHLLTNVLARPQFIAYDDAKKPFLARFAEHYALRVAWTVRSQQQADKLMGHTDAVIFEYYTPAPLFGDKPNIGCPLSQNSP